jgi:hypothetical protein
MIDVDDRLGWKRRCEVLGAAMPGYKAGGGVDESFTRAVALELGRLGSGTSVFKTFTVLTDEKKRREHNLKAIPDFRKFSLKGLSNIWLHAVKSKELSLSTPPQDNTNLGDASSSHSSSNTLKGLSILTEARILISIKFKNPTQKPIAEEIQEMLNQKTPNMEVNAALVRELDIHALFNSTSSLVLMSMPIWLWVSLPHDTSLQYVGVIRSPNLLPPTTLLATPSVSEESAKEHNTASPSFEIDSQRREPPNDRRPRGKLEVGFTTKEFREVQASLANEKDQNNKLLDKVRKSEQEKRSLDHETREKERWRERYKQKDAEVKLLSERLIERDLLERERETRQTRETRAVVAQAPAFHEFNNDFSRIQAESQQRPAADFDKKSIRPPPRPRTHLNPDLFVPQKKKKSFFSDPDLDEMTRNLNKRLPENVMRMLDRRGQSSLGRSRLVKI